MKKTFWVPTWCVIAGGVDDDSDWRAWLEGDKTLTMELPRSPLTSVPSKISRRLDRLGRCVLSATERCLEKVQLTEPEIISTSRHGDLPFMAALIETVRSNDDVSPTSFAYSVHNRFSSLISMLGEFKGENAAYSSEKEGFPIALAEALTTIESDPGRTVILVAYEPEIPADYIPLVKQTFFPHAAVFVLQGANSTGRCYQLERCNEMEGEQDGSCFVFLKTLLSDESSSDGYWRYVCCQ